VPFLVLLSACDVKAARDGPRRDKTGLSLDLAAFDCPSLLDLVAEQKKGEDEGRSSSKAAHPFGGVPELNIVRS
jgi:hypothetical protein